jgi:hypothetical protein
MPEPEQQLSTWESERRLALAGLMEALDAGELDLDADPLAFAGVLDRFLAGQDYATLEQDDWIWLNTSLAAYVAEVLIRKYGAHWRLEHDARGPNYMLVAQGRDGREHAVSPMDVVYDDFRQLPPVVLRMIATAELTANLVPAYEG